MARHGYALDWPAPSHTTAASHAATNPPACPPPAGSSWATLSSRPLGHGPPHFPDYTPLLPRIPALPFSWLKLGNPFDTALGFALLVFLVEGITVADATPRQMSQYLQAVSARACC